ncbi:hypothetical protein MSG28_003630 [Choristoneura fumiferana]|uniref:Uncharacterized protein n=1 Tax=Choristoneura fumiferana TaxID=7141 RepID=A0ACC0KFT4_CHOFU|nr:hypothetical protein MSG28_003630 [Choristoneura fumiferana]
MSPVFSLSRCRRDALLDLIIGSDEPLTNGDAAPRAPPAPASNNNNVRHTPAYLYNNKAEFSLAIKP